MVKSATSLTGSGVRDWLIQRTSAIFMTLYIIVLAIYFATHPAISFYDWQSLFANPFMRIATVLFWLLLLLHTWLGLWTVVTDYLKNTRLRLLVLAVIALVLFACFIWSIEILWGI